MVNCPGRLLPQVRSGLMLQKMSYFAQHTNKWCTSQYGFTGSGRYPRECSETVESVDFPENLINNVGSRALDVISKVYFQAGEINASRDSNALWTKQLSSWATLHWATLSNTTEMSSVIHRYNKTCLVA
jgi:hypothetical protein